jgi:N-carbamoylputrescine amidase
VGQVPPTLRITACELRGERLESDWSALVEHVRRERSDLVLLPEMGLSPWFARQREFDADAWRSAVDAHARHLSERLADLGGVVALGSAPVERDGRRLNEAFVATRDGVRPAHLKYHLPDEEDFWEASWYERGDGRFDLADAAGARVGFLVCTEMWFGQRARAYGEGGAHLLAIPRCTPRESLDRWLAGGRTTAIVAGAYAISSNHADERFGGQGWIVDPDGDVLAVTSPQQPFVTVEVDLAAAEAAKSTYPRYVAAD